LLGEGGEAKQRSTDAPGTLVGEEVLAEGVLKSKFHTAA